jgi:hypothetical protein
MLVSNAIDQCVSRMDFRNLSGQKVFFDPQYLDGCVDKGYLVSSLRQHLLACGCLLMEDRPKATFVVEARSGAVGTDRHQLLIGVPQMTMPVTVPGAPAAIPEISLAKRTDQNGVAKVAVFAYNRLTGERVWQSGTLEAKATSKDVWLFGTGPFQKGTVKSGETASLGDFMPVNPFESPDHPPAAPAGVSVTQASAWKQTVALPAEHRQPAPGPAPASLTAGRGSVPLQGPSLSEPAIHLTANNRSHAAAPESAQKPPAGSPPAGTSEAAPAP